MASVLRTLQNLRDGVAEVADVNVAASGVRHTNAVIDMRINRAWARWYTLLAEACDDSYLKRATLTTSPVATATGGAIESNRFVVLPDTALIVRSCDIYDNNIPITMLPVDLLERNDSATMMSRWQSGMVGLPTFYRLTSQTLGGSPTQPSSVLEIFPWANAAYRIDAWYVPGYSTLVNSTDQIECVSSGDEWIINDAAMQTLRNDGLADIPAFSALAAQNAKLEAEMRFSAACRANPRKFDTVALRNSLKRWWP